MSKLFIEILDENRQRVFEQLRAFGNGRYLVGGTALALQLKHRKSVDFDVFTTNSQISASDRREVIKVFGNNLRFTADNQNQLTFLTKELIKVTFVYTPYGPLHQLINNPMLPLPLLSAADIASDKAFTVGRRAAYRDYVDLYFILKSGAQLGAIIKETSRRYGAMFEEKLFIEQLEYMEDLTDRQIDYLDESRSFEEIHEFLHQQVKQYLE